MTTQSRLMLSVAAMCFGLALAPAAFAQAMSNPSGDKMAESAFKVASSDNADRDIVPPADTMAKPADKSDVMKKGDGKKKDTMAKPAATSSAMIKGDDTKMKK